MRCALEKYWSTGKCPSELEAIKKFYSAHIAATRDQLKFSNSNKWRQERLFDCKVDNLMKAYRPVWEHLWSENCVNKSGPKRFVTQEKFLNFVKGSGLLNDQLETEALPLIYNISMMTQIDEVGSTRHLEATLVEFMEMVCRCADIASRLPQGRDASEGMPL